MKKLLVSLYNGIPKSFRTYLGGLSGFRRMRDLFLKKGRSFREVSARIERSYQNHTVDFEFYASIKEVARASKLGIENTLINNVIALFNDKYKEEQPIVGFDIGANFGYLSLVWGQTICANNGKIYAFEPNPFVFKSLLRSVDKSALKHIIVPKNKAVGLKNKTIELFLDNATSNVNKASGTLTKKNIESTMVSMTTLDSFININNIEGCDFIKIDVDGIELDILLGSKETIMRFTPILVVETNDDMRIIDYFNEINYKVLDMELIEYVYGTPLPLNIFCIPN